MKTTDPLITPEPRDFFKEQELRDEANAASLRNSVMHEYEEMYRRRIEGTLSDTAFIHFVSKSYVREALGLNVEMGKMDVEEDPKPMFIQQIAASNLCCEIMLPSTYTPPSKSINDTSISEWL